MSTIAAGTTGTTALQSTGDTTGNLVFQTNGTTTALTLTTTQAANFVGVVSDAAGNLRAIPQSGSAKTSSYTLATGDVGEFIQVSTGGSIVIPDATFSTGDVVSVFNNTSGSITITCTITTAYIGGTDADKATVSLATRGVCTILFISGTVCVITGNVS
jgi:hypothetical protein